MFEETLNMIGTSERFQSWEEKGLGLEFFKKAQNGKETVS